MNLLLKLFSTYLGLFFNFCLIVGTIWVLCLGKWGILLFALFCYIFAKFFLSIALIPGAMLGNISEVNYSQSRFGLGLFFSGVQGFYTNMIQSLYCTNIFWIMCSNVKDVQTFIPLALLAYAIANAPWNSMAREEVDSFATLVSLHAINMGCLLLITTSFFFHPTFGQAVILVGMPPIIGTLIILFTTYEFSKNALRDENI